MTYRRILLALDTSSDGQPLVAAATALARRTGAEVFVLHAGPAPGEPPEEGDAASEAMAELRESGVRAAALTAPAPRGRAAPALAEFASAIDADVVLMGSRGIGELRALVTSSDGHQAGAAPSRPVMLVSDRAAARPAAEARRVLAAVGGRSDVEPIIAAVTGLGQVDQVILLHVRRTPLPADLASGAEHDAEVERLLNRLVARLREHGVLSTWRMGHQLLGSIARAIVREAAECRADVVVVGSRKTCRGLRPVFGSTADGVAQRSDRPVLVATSHVAKVAR